MMVMDMILDSSTWIQSMANSANVLEPLFQRINETIGSLCSVVVLRSNASNTHWILEKY